MAKRKLISWRIDNLSVEEQDKLNAWLDQQHNIQKSITNVVMHTINQIGISDVMSFENQKRLYQDFAAGAQAPVVPVITQKVVTAEPKRVVETTVVEVKNIEKQPVEPTTTDNDDEYLYGDLNKKI